MNHAVVYIIRRRDGALVDFFELFLESRESLLPFLAGKPLQEWNYDESTSVVACSLALQEITAVLIPGVQHECPEILEEFQPYLSEEFAFTLAQFSDRSPII